MKKVPSKSASSVQEKEKKLPDVSETMKKRQENFTELRMKPQGFKEIEI